MHGFETAATIDYLGDMDHLMTKGICVKVWIVVLVLSLLSNNGWAATLCQDEPATLAVHAKFTQTKLMIAALTCGDSDRYNAFVKKFRKDLQGANQRLVSIFQKNFGPKSPAKLNAYVTKLANELSESSLSNSTIFCHAADHIFDESQRIDSKKFSTFLTSVSASETKLCTTDIELFGG
jgi:hypothetical protein